MVEEALDTGRWIDYCTECLRRAWEGEEKDTMLALKTWEARICPSMSIRHRGSIQPNVGKAQRHRARWS